MMTTMEMLVRTLEEIVGGEWVTADRERMLDYLADETGTPIRPAPADNLILVRPASTQEVGRILAFANAQRVPVFPRGGGTGLCGGAVPTVDGIILAMERINDVEIDRDNLMAVAGAGATLGDLTEAVEREGLWFPPHPGDPSAQIGGLVACNAGGSRAVKYGVMRNYVKGIEAVLPSGELLELGGRLLKDNTGYDLMHLIIGSEGTLAVVTKAVLRLFPPVAASATMVIPFDDRHDALNSVPEILQSGTIPLAIEYMDRSAVEMSARQLGLEWPAEKGIAYLMVIVEGQSAEEVNSTCERVCRICSGHNSLEAIIGQTKKEQERVLKIRSNIYLSLKGDLADALDIAVPPASMGRLMDTIDGIAERFGTTVPTCGHAGDGNLHPTMMGDLLQGDGENLKKAKRAIYQEAVRLGGIMTAEHGVGRVRIPDLDLFLSETKLELMRGIKRVFDPNWILNPGCLVEPD
jgi:glycolate oxidase